MSDPGNTRLVSLHAVRTASSDRDDNGTALSRSEANDEQAKMEQALPKQPSEDSPDKQAGTDEPAGPRVSRRMRLARLRALQEKSQRAEGQAADDSSLENPDAIAAADPAAEGKPAQSKVPPLPATAKRRQLALPAAEPQDDDVAVLALPQRGRPRPSSTIISFVLCVLLPLAAIGGYFFFYASNQYVSAFKFVVRDARTAATGTSQASGLQSLFGATSASSPVENYMVADYLMSREAVDTLQAKIKVISLYSRPDIDWFSRFGAGQPVERFMNYWPRMVSASFDSITGIGSAQIRAFTPEDAYQIARHLVSQSEELVNAIANKPQQDAIKFAEADLKRAEDRLKAIRKDLNELRNTEQVIDPQTNVVASNILLAQTLRANLSQLQTEMSSLSKQKLNADAPAIQILQSRIRATREQLAAVESQVAYGRDGYTPLSSVVGKFEQLELERQFAANMVQSLMQNLENARAAAMAQHVYVTAFITPALPESSTYPRRLLSMMLAALILFLLWLVGLMAVRSVREHLT